MDRPLVFDAGLEYAPRPEPPLTPQQVASVLMIGLDVLTALRNGRVRGAPKFPEPDAFVGGKPRWDRATVDRYRLSLYFDVE